MKKFLLFIVFISFLWVSYWTKIDLSWCTPKTFVVSWYYSPKEWQDFYYRSNFKDEVKLNWWWYRWASWKKVFNGMIAAPKSYEFGMKIYFPWYWVWEVSDRWWAIVKAWERWYSSDRIDIWMWDWQDGLMRALSFGKRTLNGYICHDDIAVWFDYDKVKIADNFFDSVLWTISMEKWRNDKFVEMLQFYMNLLGYLSDSQITWFYWDGTEKAICDFQKKNWLVSDWSDEACGFFGPATRDRLRDILVAKWILSKNLLKTKKYKIKISNTNDKSTIENWKLETWKANETILSKNKEIIVQKDKKPDYFLTYRSYKKWDQNDEIKNIQNYLMKLGYYNWDINWKYDNDIIDAIYEFQLNNNILTWDSDYNLRWFLWMKTRELLNKFITENEWFKENKIVKLQENKQLVSLRWELNNKLRNKNKNKKIIAISNK